MVEAWEPLETLGGGGVPKTTVAWEYLPAGLCNSGFVLKFFPSIFLSDPAFWLARVCKCTNLETADPDCAAASVPATESQYNSEQQFEIPGILPLTDYTPLPQFPLNIEGSGLLLLHPFSFNSYSWFIWGIQFGIWDSFPILKKEKEKNKHSLDPTILQAEILFCIFSFPCCSLLCSFCPFSDELLRCWNSNYMNVHRIYHSQGLCWWNIFLPTLPTSK